VSTPAAVLIGLFLAAYGALALIAWRRPLVARLAYREAWRGGVQSILVVAGLAVATVGISASLVGADSSADSVTQRAYRSMGAVDLTVTADGAFFPASAADQLATDPSLAGRVDGVQGGLDLAGSISDVERRSVQSGVRIVGFDPARQNAFGAFHLTDGRSTLGLDLGAGGALISPSLAAALGAQPGDRLRMTAGSLAIEVRVAGVALREGPGAAGLGDVLFAPLGAFEAATNDQINVVRVSALGEESDGIAAGRRALPTLREAIAGLGVSGLVVNEAKAAEVRQAELSTLWDRATLVMLSMLVVAASATVVIHLALMLADERRRRLGTLRALGLTRSGLVLFSLLEGALYSFAGAALGLLPGLVLARSLGQSMVDADSVFIGSDVPFQFSVRPDTVGAAVALGALITAVTIGAAAIGTSRLSISAAIRDLPEPATARAGRLRLGVIAVAALAGFAAVLAAPGAIRLLGGIAVISAAAALLRGRMLDRARYTLAGTAVLAWTFATVATYPINSDAFALAALFFLAIVVAVFGFSVIVAANLRLGERLLALASPRLATTLRPPLAYLMRRPLRTGLGTGAFGLVLALIACFAVFSQSYRPDYARDSAGFDVIARSTHPTIGLSPALQERVARSELIQTRLYLGRLQAKNTAGPIGGESTYMPLFALSPAQLQNPPVRLVQRAPGYADDGAVWRALRTDPTLVIADMVDINDTITMWTPAGPVQRHVIGGQIPGPFHGLMGSAAAFAPFETVPAGSILLLKAGPGESPDALARSVEAELFEDGVDAVTFRALLDQYNKGLQAFLQSIVLMTRMGLLIGLLTIGIAGLRAVVERRRGIGVLRALGYGHARIATGFITEALLTALVGGLVGSVSGVLMGYMLLTLTTDGANVAVDGGVIGGVLLLVLAASVAVAAWPALRASRLPVAEALRLTD